MGDLNDLVQALSKLNPAMLGPSAINDLLQREGVGHFQFNPRIALREAGGQGSVSFDPGPRLQNFRENHPVLTILNRMLDPLSGLPTTEEAQVSPPLKIGMVPILSPEALSETSLANPEAAIERGAATQAAKASKLFDLKHVQKIADQAADELGKSGGATIHVPTGRNMAGSKNFAVSVRPDRSMVLDGPATPEQIAHYVRINRDLLNDPRHSLGLWTDGNRTYLDVTTLTSDRAHAIDLGRKANQIAVTDLSKIKAGHPAPDEAFINTGGTGEAPEGFQEPDLSDVPAPVLETVPMIVERAVKSQVRPHALVESAHRAEKGAEEGQSINERHRERKGRTEELSSR